MERLKDLNDIQLVLNEHEFVPLISYHSEPSGVPYSPNQFLDMDPFATYYSKAALANKQTYNESTFNKPKPFKFLPGFCRTVICW